MNESTQSDTPRTEKEKQSFPLHDQSGITWHDIVYADFSRQLEKPLNRLCKMAGFEITKGDNEGTAAEKVSATIAKFKQIERELDDAWKECERLRLLVPTTAQHMVYHSLLMKYEALKNELNQSKQDAAEYISRTDPLIGCGHWLHGGENEPKCGECRACVLEQLNQWKEFTDELTFRFANELHSDTAFIARYNQLKQGEGK